MTWWQWLILILGAPMAIYLFARMATAGILDAVETFFQKKIKTPTNTKKDGKI